MTGQNSQPFKVFLTSIYLYSFIGSSLFVVMYLFLGVEEVAEVCGANAILFLLSYLQVRKNHIGIALTLAFTALLVMAVLIGYYLGWSYGAHYYLVTGCMLIPASTRLRKKQILVLVIVLFLVFLVIRAFLIRHIPTLYLPRNVYLAVRDVNLLTAYSAIGVTLYRYRGALLRAQDGLTQANQRILDIANTDTVTGISSRRAVHEQLLAEMKKSIDTGSDLVVALADLDNFKDVNDTWGHECGDAVLREVCQRFGSVLRKSDSIGRWGGEEFLILLPGAGYSEVNEITERLRRAVCDVPVSFKGSEIQISITIGLSVFLPEDSDDTLIARADKLLYKGKRSGKNMVVAS